MNHTLKLSAFSILGGLSIASIFYLPMIQFVIAMVFIIVAIILFLIGMVLDNKKE